MAPEQIALFVGVCAGITELFKNFGLPSRFAPLLSLVLGVAVVFLSAGKISALLVVPGIIVGLTASGLYSGAKTLAGK